MKNRIHQIICKASVLLIVGALLSSLFLNGNEFSSEAKNFSIDNETPTRAKLQKSKIYFEENRGQVDEQARFISRGAGGYTMFLAASEAVFVLPLAESSKFQVPSSKSEIEDLVQNQKSKIKNQIFTLSCISTSPQRCRLSK